MKDDEGVEKPCWPEMDVLISSGECRCNCQLEREEAAARTAKWMKLVAVRSSALLYSQRQVLTTRVAAAGIDGSSVSGVNGSSNGDGFDDR